MVWDKVSYVQDLIGKIGENPTRSRHCEWQIATKATVQRKSMGRRSSKFSHEPGDLPCPHAPKPTRIGRCIRIKQKLPMGYW